MNNTIRGNQVDHNARDGIRVDATSTGNLIKHNRLTDNGEFDARDDSTGSDTAGTANTWVNNSGTTENRPGLLAHLIKKHKHGHDDQGDDQGGDNHGHHDHDQHDNHHGHHDDD